MSSADVPAIQAADMLVWGTRRSAVEGHRKGFSRKVSITYGIAPLKRVKIVGAGLWDTAALIRYWKRDAAARR